MGQAEVRLTSGFEDLMMNSWAIRQDIENGWYSPSVPFKPSTDSAPNSGEECGYEDGWMHNRKNGTCPKCYMLKSANGACGC